MAQDLDTGLLQYQQGTTFPVIIWKVIVRTPPPSDLDLDYQDHDLTERLMNEPNIQDAADYRENLTYINEIGVKLNNSDKFLTNESETGIFDTDVPIEIFLEGYLDVDGGEDFPIKKFTGWLDRGRMKTDSVKLNVEVVAYSYFGKGEKVSGKNLFGQYFDGNGLILFNTGMWVRDAAISGKNLKIGLHTIQTRIDSGDKQARLDDGPWTNIINGETILQNIDNTQQIKVYQALSMISDRESKIIVSEEGQTYPNTLLYNVSLFDLMKLSFKSIGISQWYIQPYEIKTYDDRKVLSFYEVPVSESDYQPVSCITSDGEYQLFIGLRNKVLKKDMLTQEMTEIFDGGINTATQVRKLIYDESIDTIFVFICDLLGFLDRIEMFVVSTGFGQTLFLNQGPKFTLGKPGNSFHYIKSLQQFVFVFYDQDASIPGIATLTLNGVITTILTDSAIAYEGFNLLYETEDDTFFFFIKVISGIPKLYRIDYTGSWSAAAYKIDFYISQTGDLVSTEGVPFYYESKLFLREYPGGEAALYSVTGNSFDVSFNPNDYLLLAPREHENKLFVLVYKASPFTSKIGYLSGGVLTLTSDEIKGLFYNFVGGDLFRMCVTKNYKGFEVLNIQSVEPNLLMRYSEWYNLCLTGEVDFTENTIREAMTELANTFLGYVKVTNDKKGFFVARSEYDSSDTLIFKKDFNKERTGERVSNEVYDLVKISNENATKQYGNESLLDPRILTRDLQFAPDEMIIDLAKYFYEYYSVARKIIKVKYPPTFYNYESLDKADMSDYGYGEGIIHKVSPKKSSCEFEVLI